jgi:hypothetical protein
VGPEPPQPPTRPWSPLDPPRLQVEDEEGKVGWRRKKAAGAPLGAAASFTTDRNERHHDIHDKARLVRGKRW